MSIDRLVSALVRRVGCIIIHRDSSTNVCMVAAWDDERIDEDGVHHPAALVYEVSVGLPGARVSSVDVDTYQEAAIEYARLYSEVVCRSHATTRAGVR